MAFTPDGKLSACPRQPLRRPHPHAMGSPQWASHAAIPCTGQAIQVAGIHADGKTLITADTGLRFWDWTTGTEQRASSDDEHCYALTADSKAVVEGSSTGVIRIWDSITGKELHRFDVPRPAPGVRALYSSVATSPDGKYLAAQGYVTRDRMAASVGRYIWIWDLATGKLLHRLNDLSPTRGPGNAMTFSPDGRTLVSTPAGSERIAWDVATGNEIKPAGKPRLAAKVAFSPDGKREMIWDGETGVFVRYADQPKTTSRLQSSGKSGMLSSSFSPPTGRGWQSRGGNCEPDRTPYRFSTSTPTNWSGGYKIRHRCRVKWRVRWRRNAGHRFCHGKSGDRRL